MSYESPIKIGTIPQTEEGWVEKISKYFSGEVDNLVIESCVKVGCHVDKDELEKALRYDRDQYVKGYEDGKRDAAAAIEALLIENKELIDDHPEMVEADGHWEWRKPNGEVLMPKRGEWITIRLNNGGSYTGCSCCEAPIPTDTMLDYIPESESKYCYSCGAKMEVQDEAD